MCPCLSDRPGPPSPVHTLGRDPNLVEWMETCDSMQGVGCPPLVQPLLEFGIGDLLAEASGSSSGVDLAGLVLIQPWSLMSEQLQGSTS